MGSDQRYARINSSKRAPLSDSENASLRYFSRILANGINILRHLPFASVSRGVRYRALEHGETFRQILKASRRGSPRAWECLPRLPHASLPCGGITVQKLLGAIGRHRLDATRECRAGFREVVDRPDVEFIAGSADRAHETFVHNGSIPLQVDSVRTAFLQSGKDLIARLRRIGGSPMNLPIDCSGSMPMAE